MERGKGKGKRGNEGKGRGKGKLPPGLLQCHKEGCEEPKPCREGTVLSGRRGSGPRRLPGLREGVARPGPARQPLCARGFGAFLTQAGFAREGDQEKGRGSLPRSLPATSSCRGKAKQWGSGRGFRGTCHLQGPLRSAGCGMCGRGPAAPRALPASCGTGNGGGWGKVWTSCARPWDVFILFFIFIYF